MIKIDRRTFLGCSAPALGAACLGRGGAAYWAAMPPPAEYLECSISGEDNMEKKVLVAYASKCGSTGETAKAVAEEIAARGKSVDVRPAENVKDISGYSAVVLGSAVRFGRWLPPAACSSRPAGVDLRMLPAYYGKGFPCRWTIALCFGVAALLSLA
jgi:menaquinone-dependent protoporphyrinogen oxidase